MIKIQETPIYYGFMNKEVYGDARLIARNCLYISLYRCLSAHNFKPCYADFLDWFGMEKHQKQANKQLREQGYLIKNGRSTYINHHKFKGYIPFFTIGLPDKEWRESKSHNKYEKFLYDEYIKYRVRTDGFIIMRDAVRLGIISQRARCYYLDDRQGATLYSYPPYKLYVYEKDLQNLLDKDPITDDDVKRVIGGGNRYLYTIGKYTNVPFYKIVKILMDAGRITAVGNAGDK